MKTIVCLFYMMLLLSNIGVLRGDYSINPFLDYLQEKGYYDIIQSVKIYFGDDIAIDICKELAPTIDCETVVRVYMTGENESGSEGNKRIKRPPPNDTQTYQQILEDLKNKYNMSEEMYHLIEIILSFYDNLLNNMNREEIIEFIEKIISNPNVIEDFNK